MAMATLEERARFLLKAAEGRVREAEEKLQARAQDLARHSTEWSRKVEAGRVAIYLADLAFIESEVAAIRAAEAELDRERAIAAVLGEVVGA